MMQPANAVSPHSLSLIRRLEAIEARLSELERARAPRDVQDTALRQALAESTRGLPFRVAELIAHAEIDSALRTRLVDATIETSAELGAWLRDQRGERDEVSIERLPRRRWRAAYTSARHMPGG